MNSPYLHNVHQTESDTAGAGGGGGGVYKDRYRWLAVLYVPQGVSQGRHHMLGRFDSEDEAGAAYKWVQDITSSTTLFLLLAAFVAFSNTAIIFILMSFFSFLQALEEVRITGAYSSRRKKRLSIMLDGSAVTLSGSASASQLASAATAAAFATAVASATAAASANAAASAVSATTAASATAASTTAATTTATAASATTTTNATANTAPSSLPLAPTPVAPSAQAQAPPLETKAS